MTIHAQGTFAVNLAPQPPDSSSQPTAISRMLIDKQFEGDLEAVSKGQMLAAGTAVDGSAGYVAVEEVRGVLNGRRGSFILQHTGIMNRGDARLTITVVPDSGTDQLVGLLGEMAIHITEDEHSYEFIYSLPDAA
ncbi:MAG: DUF3224 domain-containing protein [Anaerolineae bacterium]|jgi:hypothetical protein